MSFRPNRRAVAELKADPRYKRTLTQAASESARMARALAPDGGPHLGYRETVRSGERDGKVVVESTDPFAHIVEWGSRNNPAYAPLRRGVRAAGLDLHED